MKAFILLLIALTTTLKVQAQEDASESWCGPDTNAEPPGGRDEFRRIVQEMLIHPGGDPIAGKVFVEFIVQEDGTLTRFKALKGIDAIYDSAAVDALRRVANIPWTPATRNVKPIKQKYILPVLFK